MMLSRINFFDQLLWAARQLHVVYSDQLLGAARHIHLYLITIISLKIFHSQEDGRMEYLHL